MNKLLNSELITSKGFATLGDVYITELGHVMVKVNYEDGTFINHNIGNIKTLLKEVNIKLNVCLFRSN